jgi:hypothetical protein
MCISVCSEGETIQSLYKIKEIIVTVLSKVMVNFVQKMLNNNSMAL